MIKKVFLTLAFCLIGSISLSAQNWDASEEASYHSSIVKVTGDGYSGSGTVIKFIEDSEKHEGYYVGWVLTASHVVRSKETRFRIYFNNGEITKNGVVILKKNDVIDSFNDLALIRALIPDDIVPMEVSTEDIPIGAEVELCGYATGNLRHWTAPYAGECVDNGGHVVFSWGIQGDSGGPIIYNGKVVGVICFGTGVKEYKDTQRMIVCPVYGSNVERIKDYLKEDS
tara:strand:+ start:694 stop:1374 length:681 start_codon:yes stop_codon:yes gene_type:complete